MTTAAEEKISGFAVRCGADGAIIEIVRDGDGAAHCGASFFELVDSDSRAKAIAFFDALRQQKAVFGWEMNVAKNDGGVESMHFAGALAEFCEASAGESFLIVAAASRRAVSRVYNDLARLSGEQANSLRSALKDLSMQMREQADRDSHFYDELSRLNNELTTAQRELARKNAELARLNEQKNLFLGIASHDLRNPLEVISMYSEFLLENENGLLNKEQLDFIGKIYGSSAFMLNLVNDFLDYSKIEAGRFELRKSKVNLFDLIERTVARFRFIAAKKRIEIGFRAAEDLPAVNADESKLEQVLNNLISNAIKFSPVESVIEIALQTDEGGVILSVRDRGAGIAADELETLFNPFVEGGTKASGGEKSSGLGLAIVKKIVEGHGGAVRFETAPGKGTVFHVSLPV